MNRLLFFQGGQPRYLDDKEYFQNAILEAFKAISAPYGGNCIHGGVLATPSGANYVMGSGYISIDGEILWFPGQTLVGVAPTALKVVVDVTYDAAGYVEFQDNFLRNTFEIRRAKFVATTDPRPGVLYTALKRVPSDIVAELFASQQFSDDVLQVLSDLSDFAARTTATLSASSGWASVGSPKVVRQAGRAILDAVFTKTGSTSLAFTLPVGYRPASDWYYLCPTDAQGGLARVHVASNGAVNISEQSTVSLSSGDTVYLHSCLFVI